MPLDISLAVPTPSEYVHAQHVLIAVPPGASYPMNFTNDQEYFQWVVTDMQVITTVGVTGAALLVRTITGGVPIWAESPLTTYTTYQWTGHVVLGYQDGLSVTTDSSVAMGLSASGLVIPIHAFNSA